MCGDTVDDMEKAWVGVVGESGRCDDWTVASGVRRRSVEGRSFHFGASAVRQQRRKVSYVEVDSVNRLSKPTVVDRCSPRE